MSHHFDARATRDGRVWKVEVPDIGLHRYAYAPSLDEVEVTAREMVTDACGFDPDLIVIDELTVVLHS